MNVTLPVELAEFVDEKVRSGRYSSVGEVIDAGLRLLQESEKQQQRLQELRRDLDVGIEQAKQGNVSPVNAQALLAQIRQERRTCRPSDD